MTKLIGILLLALVLEAIGVVFLSKGLKEIGELQQYSAAEFGRVALRGLGNGSIWIGIGLEAGFFVLLLTLLHGWDVSLIWPLTALGFVLTTLAAKFIRHEEVSSVRWSGVLLIMLGAALVAYSEKLKPNSTDHPPTAAPNSSTK
jgi:uncharacterized membrane protein